MEAGKQLLHYRLVEQIGEGGMGVVWRATDTTLRRDVAIKLLPEHVAADAERLARFEREAKLLASLNHPNIATIHGLHQVDDVSFLAMELLEGEDLSAQLQRGPLSVDEAIAVGLQLAAALESAHEAGVIHRDFKPANIMVGSDGIVKVLDFGLAKALIPETASGSASASLSPTVTSAGTMVGTLLGTAAYMSPEQARGRPVGRTADLWAFGCVLLEMLTGRPTFKAETITDIIAAVVTREPDWESLPAETPPALRRLLRRCLEKDLRQRLQHAGDARLELEESRSGSPELLEQAQPPARSRYGLLATAVLIALAAGFGLARFLPTSSPAISGHSTHLELTLEHQLDASGVPRRVVALSPDGRRLVYSAQEKSERRLFIRGLDGSPARALSGTEGGTTPFFSPDGRSIGFFASGKLKKVSLSGGAPQVLADTRGQPYGGSWGDDGTILFISGTSLSPLSVPAGGGEVQEVEAVWPEGLPGTMVWPELLPGAKAFLVTLTVGTGLMPENRIAVVSRETGKVEVLDRGSDVRFVSGGYIVYAQGDAMLAARFDGRSLRKSGPGVALPLVAPVDLSGGIPGLAISREGTVINVNSSLTADATLAWVDREGRVLPLPLERRAYAAPALSPDEKQVVLWVRSQGTGIGDLWIYDMERDDITRLTFDHQSGYPFWGADGVIHYISAAQASQDIGKFANYARPADGSTEPVQTMAPQYTRLIRSFTPDGETILFYEVHPKTQRDIWSWKLDEEPKPLLVTQYNERSPILSPDGRWFAYVSNEGGKDDVYVRSFPEGKKRIKISLDGGVEPLWRADGGELFYRDQDRMMAVAVTSGESLRAERPVEIFRGLYLSDGFGNANYDVSKDGQRFLMIQGDTSGAASVQVILNWLPELERIVDQG
jgi:serine/threonine protein kinase